MEKPLLNTFPGLSLSDRQKKLFQDVCVEGVVVAKESRKVSVKLVSSHVIPYREMIRLEDNIGRAFAATGYQVHVEDRFRLSDQYTPEIFWKEYRDSILLLLKEDDVLEFNMFYRGESHMEDQTLYLCCEDDSLFRARETQMIEKVRHIFETKAGYQIDMEIRYREQTASEVDFYGDDFRLPKVEAQRDRDYQMPEIGMAGENTYHTPGDGSAGEHTYRAPEAGSEGGNIYRPSALERGNADHLSGPNVSGETRSSLLHHSEKTEGQTAVNGITAEKPKSGAGQGSPGERVAKASSASAKKDKTSKWGGNTYQGRARKKGGYRASVDEDCFFGRNCDGEITKIADIQGEMEIVIEGMVTAVEEREIQDGRKVIYMFHVTDFTDTIQGKVFLAAEEVEEFRNHVSKGKFVKIKGVVTYDTYSREDVMTSIRGMKPGQDHRVRREDHYDGPKRVELHAHTQMSEMDSVMEIGQYIQTAKRWGHPAIAITDHGVVQAFPDADHILDPGDDLKMIYGVEAYLVDDLIETVQNERGQDFTGSFVVFDLETTGIGAKSNEIIEIGAVRVDNRTITDRYSTFINPGRPIPFHITQLTGIDDSMVRDAADITAVLGEFLQWCGDAVMVAHNASFDIGFIQQKAKDQGISCDFTVVDTVSMSRALLPELKNYKLDTVAKKLGVSLENHHRAVEDAEATAEIFLHLLKKLEDRGIQNLQQLNETGKPDAEAICKMPSYHAVILAKNETGRINLYRLISESHLHYFRRRPRLPKSLFMQWREGLLIGSACEAGELYRALVEEKPEEEIDRLVRFYDYLEIQPLGNNAFMVRDEDRYPQIQDENDLMEINRRIVELGEIYHKLVVATCDVHFLNPEDEIYRRIIMSGKGFADADQQAPLYYRTTEEMLAEFQYLGAKKAEEIVVTNTNRIADMIDRIRPCSPRKCPPVIENSDQDLRDICYNKAHEIYGPDLPPQVTERLERELTSIIGNGYAVMYIIAQKLVWKSVEDGYLVGSRGSVGSSFAATMAGITEINPLPAHYYCSECHYYDFDDEVLHANAGTSACDMPDKICPKCGTLLKKEGHDIPFETFLGFKGDKEPDIDLNFSNEYQSNAHDYTEVIFGAGQTFRAGTVGTMADKTAYGYVKKYCEEHEVVKRSAEMERIAQGCVGVRRTTGQHPGGIVVLPIGEEIYTFTPVQHPANDMSTKIITTHFDYHKIDANLLKLDILGHLDPTMIRMLEDLTDIDASVLPMDDPDVLSLFASTKALQITPDDIEGCTLGCLGIPEFGTNFVMGMLLDAKPKNFSDLVRISGLSHGTDVWLNNAQYYIQNGDCTLSTAICTRDDIMIYLISKGVENERSFKIMEAVRKGTVAKGKCPMWEEWKQDMLDHDVPAWYIESCEKIKYMFPKAHAAAYVMMALRVAYFKVHEPLAYYAAFFSIRALDAFNYEMMCQGRDRLEYYMKDYNRRKDTLSNKEKEVYEIMRLVQEMYARGLSFTPIDLYRSKATRFQIVDGKIMPSFAAIDGLGSVAAELIEDEAAKGTFLSREDFKNRCKVNVTTVETMGELGLFGELPHTNQISLMDFMEMA